MIVTKAINLDQLAGECRAAGQSADLVLIGNELEQVDQQGNAVELSAEQQSLVAAHTAMRDVTDEEYAAEFQNPATTPARKQEIRDITAGLLPREQVPM
jgi:hypothetical protein